MCNDEPLASICIITYNQIEFIEETLKSALEQDYKTLEVVVADDASTDGTAEVILQYAKRYPDRLKTVIGKVNRGITGNSNRALEECKGKYIAFQGGDDVLLPGKITAQVAWMEEDKSRVLCGHQIEVFYDNGSRSHVLTPKLQSGKGCKWVIENGCPFGATSIMVRSDRIPSSGFDERLPVVSDQMLWIDCLGESGRFGYIPGIYARYRRHSGNVTGDNRNCITDQIKMFNQLENSHPEYLKSVKKGRRTQVDINRGKLFLLEKQYLGGAALIARTYMLSPTRLKATIFFKLRKLKGGWATILYYIFAQFIPGFIGKFIRSFLCGKIFPYLGKNVNICTGTRFGKGSLITIGDNSGLGEGCYLVSMATISIGKDVMVGPQVMMLTGGHAYDDADIRLIDQKQLVAPIVIGNDVWVGARVIVLPGVTIGNRVVIGAGSVVTRSLPNNTICAGVPCKVLKKI